MIDTHSKYKVTFYRGHEYSVHHDDPKQIHAAIQRVRFKNVGPIHFSVFKITKGLENNSWPADNIYYWRIIHQSPKGFPTIQTGMEITRYNPNWLEDELAAG